MFKKYGKLKKNLLTPEQIKEKAELNMSKLNPMVYSFLSIKSKEDSKNDFVKNSFEVLNKNPERLTDKWINSLNKWAVDLAEKMSLEPPELKQGDRKEFNLKIHKIKAESCYSGSVSQSNLAKSNISYYKIFCFDKNGWQYYFCSGREMFYDIFKELIKENLIESKKDYNISFSASVSKQIDGITFLRRATKINISK